MYLEGEMYVSAAAEEEIIHWLASPTGSFGLVSV